MNLLVFNKNAGACQNDNIYLFTYFHRAIYNDDHRNIDDC